MFISKKIDKYLGFFCVILIVAFILMPQLKYYSIHTGVADLGFFLAGLYKVNTQWPLIFYGHVQPYMYIYGLLFKVFPNNFVPFVLLALQSFSIIISILLMKKYYGNLAGIALLLYSPIWANNLFDFHFDHIAILLLATFFVGCKTKRYALAACSALLLCFVKEVFALEAAVCGVYLIIEFYKSTSITERLRRFLISILIISFACSWFFFSILFLLPYFSDSGKTILEGGAFSWLGNGIKEIISTIVFNPTQILLEILSRPKKILYIAVLLGPFIFIPLLKPLPLLVGAPIFMISMLSQQSNFYDYNAHYSSGLIIPIVVAFVEGVELLKKRYNSYSGKVIRMGSLNYLNNFEIINFLLICWLIIFQIIVGISPISRLFWSNKIWSLNYHAYISSTRDSIIRDSIEKYIPSVDHLIVSSQNNINYLPLAIRQNLLIFPGGVTDPHILTNWDQKTFSGFLGFVKGQVAIHSPDQLAYADFVLIDTKRPYFIYDLGCDTSYNICFNKKIENIYIYSIHNLEIKYQLLYEYDGFKIYKIKK